MEPFWLKYHAKIIIKDFIQQSVYHAVRSLSVLCTIIFKASINQGFIKHWPASLAKGPSQHWCWCLIWLNGNVLRSPQQYSIGGPGFAWHSCTRSKPPKICLIFFVKFEVYWPLFEWRDWSHWSSNRANCSDSRLSHSQMFRRQEPSRLRHLIPFWPLIKFSVSWYR